MLFVTKRLAPKEDDLQGLTASVPLPSVLYKLFEKKEGDDSVVSSAKNSVVLFYVICTGLNT
jgi:sister-chromatid-cohesion protein PDS5